MGTLVKSGLTGSYATYGGRHVDVDSSGNVWCMLYNLASTRMEFWYSTDGGSSFTENTSLRTTLAANLADQGHAFFIGHDINGEQVAVWCSAGSLSTAGYYCRAFSTSSTAWTSQDWLAGGTDYVGSIFIFESLTNAFGTGRSICVLSFATNASTSMKGYTASITPAWNIVSQDDANSCVSTFVGADFEHTGDGRTATESDSVRPYPLTSYSETVSVDFDKWNWVSGGGAGSFKNGTARVLDATKMTGSDPIAGVCDGTRYITAFISDASDTVIQWFERDIADTTSTERTPTALSDGAVTNLAIRRDADNNTILYAVGTTSDDIKKLVYDRTGNSFGAWETLETTNAVANSLSVQAGYQSADGSAYYCWTHDNGSTYDVYVGLDGPATNKGVPWAGLML